MFFRFLFAGAAICCSAALASAQTYGDSSGTVAPGFAPLIGCSAAGKCNGPVSSTNPMPVVISGGGGGSVTQGGAATASGAWPFYPVIGGAPVSASNGLFVAPTAGATFPVNGAVSISGAVNTVASNPASIFSMQQTCNVTASALPSQALTNGVVVKALKTNTAIVYLGGSGVAPTSGYPLVAGESISYAVSSLSSIYLICQNTTDVIAITGN